MKKLLHLQLLPLLTGVQNFSLHLLEGLPAGEFEIWVASQPGGEFVRAAKSRGYRFLPLRFLRHPISPLDLPAFLELYWLLRRHRFDIVHTNSSKPGLLGRIAATLAGVPLVLHTVHGTSFQAGQSAATQRLYRFLERVGNLFCHTVAFVNNSDRERCLRLRLLSPRKAVTIYNALPPALSARLAEVAAQRSPRESGEEFVIGSTLRFSTQKNVVNVVGAACQACAGEPRLRFILLGEGEQLQLCRQIVRSHGLSERVLLPGWDPDVAPWLGKFDAFLLYSRWEAQPFSVIEAMHAALPVIGSGIDSIAELVDDSCGWLVPLDDQQALIDCLVRVSRVHYLAYEKGQNARRRILRLCDHRQMVQRYLAIYRGQSAEVGEER